LRKLSLGGQIEALRQHEGTLAKSCVPADWKNRSCIPAWYLPPTVWDFMDGELQQAEVNFRR